MDIYIDKTHDGFFDKSQTTALKGFCIILVFIHHFCQYISYSRFSLLVLLLGPVAVNIFFLIAGYTTILSLEKGNNGNLNHFLIKRALRLYMPFILVSITYNNFLGGLLWMYITCYIAYKYVAERYRLSFIFLMNIAFIVDY